MSSDRRHDCRPSPNRRRRATRASLESLEPRQLLATVSWASDAGGSWDVAANWSTGTVPQAGDDVVIDRPGADPIVTFDSGVNGAYNSVTVKDTLDVVGGTLISDALTINGELDLAGGQVVRGNDTGSFLLAGTTNWTSGDFYGTGTEVNTGTLNLTGTAEHTLFAGSTLDNRATFNLGGTLTQGNQYGPGATINEAGATLDFLATGILTSGTLTNAGTIAKSQPGTATITSGATFNSNAGTFDVTAGTLILDPVGTITDPTFDVAHGASVEVDDGSTWTGSVTGSGGGLVELNIAYFSGLTVDAATFDFPAGMLQWTQGGIYGQWTNTGDLTIPVSASNSQVVVGWLDNAGTVELGAALTLGNQYGSGSLTNQAGATLTLQGAASIGGGAFVNSGTLIKSGSGSATINSSTFDNLSGPIDVTGGSLVDPAGGSSTATDFTVSAGAEFDLTGTSSWTGLLAGSGGGLVVLEPGYFDSLNLDGATLDFPAGMLDWSSSTLAGAFTNLGSLSLSTANPVTVRGSLTNSGTIDILAASAIILGDQYSPGLIDNRAGGTINVDLAGGSSLTLLGNSFTNEGTFDVGPGLSIDDTRLPTNNTGTINLAATSSLMDETTDVGGVVKTGTYNVGAGATLTFDGLGPITENDAVLSLGGPGATITALGSLAENVGTLAVGPGASLAVAGNLANSGTIALDSGAGLSVAGGFTQAPTGTLSTQVGTYQAAASAGLLSVTGVATLDGTLAVTRADGFSPAAGQTVPILDYGSESGSFARVTGLTSGGSAIFQLDVGATQASLTGLATGSGGADLAVTGVTAPTGPVLVGSPFAISYTVKDAGTLAAAGNWTDSVYLAKNGTVAPGDILLGRVTHSGGLAAGASYTGTLTADLPATLGDYQIVVLADSGEALADPNRSNNVGVAPGSIAATVPTIAVGGSVSGTVASGQDMLYQINVPAGTSVSVSLGGAAGSVALLARAGALPGDASFDEYARSLDTGTSSVTIGGGQGGPVYLLVEPNAKAGGGEPFMLSTAALGFSAGSFSPQSFHGSGAFTLAIAGSGFTTATTATLVQGTTVIKPTRVTYLNSSTIEATFDPSMVGIAAGSFQVAVADGSRTITPPGTFSQTPITVDTDPDATHKLINISLSAPSLSRSGYPETLTITYTNTSDQPVPATLLALQSSNTAFAVAGSTDFAEHQLLLLTIDQGGPAGFLPAGYTGTITVTARPDVYAPHINNDFELSFVDDYSVVQNVGQGGSLAGLAFPAVAATGGAAGGQAIPTYPSLVPVTIDWAADLAGDRPAGMSDAGWNRVIANLIANVGDTFAQVQSTLDADATYLSTLGIHDSSFDRLIGFEIDRAGAYGSIAAASVMGSLGYGQFTPADFHVIKSGSDVSVVDGAQTTDFALQPGGAYLGPDGDPSRLGLSGGAFQLTQADGSVVSFNADGSFHSQLAPDGTGEVAGYANGKLSTLTDNLGRVTTYAYNAAGLVAAETDPSGLVTTYGYDVTGRYLTSVSSPSGTTQYRYGLVDGSLYEMTAIISPAGVATNLQYDGSGRLIGINVGGQDQQFLSDPAGTPGAIDVTDASGATTQFLLDANGQVAALIDATGKTALSQRDVNGNVTSFTYPDGTVATSAYDAEGDLLSTVDPLGDSSSFGYDPTTHRITSYQDANANTTAYAVNAKGQTTAVTYADGSTSSTTFDASGRVATTTDRAGSTTTLAYAPASDDVASTTFGDSARSTFTYDSRHDVLTATNAQGTTTFTYNAAGQTTSVSYPNGLSLTYTYDAGGRLASMTDQSGYAEFDAYDSAGRLSRVTDKSGNLLAGYSYDAEGRVSTESEADGASTTTTYDADGRVGEIDNLGSNGVLLSKFVYAYDADGRVATVATLQGTTTYAYDAAGRLVAATLPGGRTLAYAYDAAGNRTSMTDSGTTTTASTNVLDEVTAEGPTTYRYDADGNLLSSTDASGTTTYQYDEANHLVGVTSPTSGTYQYLYDALGHRIASIHDGVRTDELFDPTGGDSLVGQFDGSTPLDHYVYGLGLVDQVDASGVANAYGFDALGNTAELAGPGGSVLDAYTYLPSGTLASSSGAASNPFTFVGEAGVITDGSGLSSMRARSYDPATGTFTQPDPSGLAGGLNAYEYAGDAPNFKIDPSGLEPEASGSFYGRGNNVNDFLDAAQRENSGQHPATAQVPVNPDDTQYQNSQQHAPGDPNDISGPSGFGSAGFVRTDQVLPYSVLFENKPTATAAAAVITITETLSPNLDWSTFQLGSIELGELTIDVPAGLSSYKTQVDARSTLGVLVDVSAGLDEQTGVVTWTLTAIDPATLDVPSDPNVGLLPVDDATGRGAGSVSYTIEAKSNLTTGAILPASASIVFDTNAAIATPTIQNTIDAVPPTARVSVLPTNSPTAILVSWAGVDDQGGSGLASYDLYVSIDGGPLALVDANTTRTSEAVLATAGHVYGFAVVATDNVGQSGTLPTAPQASTNVVNPTATVTLGQSQPIQAGSTFSLPGSFTDNLAGPYSATVDYGDGTTSPLTLGPDGSFMLSHAYIQSGTYQVEVTITDPSGTVGKQGLAVDVLAPSVTTPPVTTPPVMTPPVMTPPVTTPPVATPPVIVITLPGSASGLVGSTVSIPGSFADDAAGPYTAAVVYGDGTPASLVSLGADGTFALSHAYDRPGLYQVEVAIADGAGGLTLQVVSVNIAGSKIALTLPPPALIGLGATFASIGLFSDNAAGPYTVTINYGDGSGVRPATASNGAFPLEHTYQEPGIYRVGVVVTDSFGSFNYQYFTVTVVKPLPVSGYGPGKDAFAITLYQELLGRTPNLDELIAFDKRLDGPLSYPLAARSIVASREYKLLQVQHRGTGISLMRAYLDAARSRNLSATSRAKLPGTGN